MSCESMQERRKERARLANRLDGLLLEIEEYVDDEVLLEGINEVVSKLNDWDE